MIIINRRNLLIIGLIAVAAAGSAVVFVSPRAQKAQPVSLRLAWIPGATFTGDYVALNKGFWKDEGLDVAVNPGGFESDAIKLVASGAETFGITSGSQLLQARANGVPIVAIGAIIPINPVGWVAKKSSGIKTPQDFVGKKVGAQFGTHSEITAEALYSKLGIPVSSINRIPVKFDPLPFVSGAIDVLPVYLVDQPIDLSMQGLDLNIIDPRDYGISLAYGNLYFTREDVITKNSELVRQFLRGAQKGWLWTRENPDQAIDILASYMQDPNKQALRKKLDAIFSVIMKDRTTYAGVLPMEQEAWNTTKNILVKYGNLPKDADVAKAFTDAFLTR